VTKLAGEHVCALYARARLCTVALRFFTVFGPRQRPDMAFNRFMRRALTGEPVDV
jgi:UDP-glucuronate 4-epimerase